MIKDWLTEFRPAIAAQIQVRMEEYRVLFAEVGDEVDDLFAVAGPMLDGGKRLRAAFLAAGWRGFGGEALSVHEVHGGAGLELFQMAALVHDDLMDNSRTRRGLPAAHRQFQVLHTQRGMINDAEEFGRAGALLLGDLLLVSAEAELQVALEGLVRTAAASREVFETMMAEVTVGQYLDIFAQSAPWSVDPGVDLDRARRVIRAKSARYSVEHPLTLGATMAGATPAEQAAVRAVGLPVGEAFQLRDDILGVFGDPEVTGKPAGDDLREGKRTVLVTLAMTRADSDLAATLKGSIGNPYLSEADVERVREILIDTGARDGVESLIAERDRAARTAIDALRLAPGAAEILHGLADAAISRQY